MSRIIIWTSTTYIYMFIISIVREEQHPIHHNRIAYRNNIYTERIAGVGADRAVPGVPGRCDWCWRWQIHPDPPSGHYITPPLRAISLTRCRLRSVGPSRVRPPPPSSAGGIWLCCPRFRPNSSEYSTFQISLRWGIADAYAMPHGLAMGPFNSEWLGDGVQCRYRASLYVLCELQGRRVVY